MKSFSTEIMLPLDQVSSVIVNPSVEDLISACLREDDCKLTDTGAVVAYSGKYRGRVPKLKYIVEDEQSAGLIWWVNNKSMPRQTFNSIRSKAVEYAKGRKIYVIDTFAGADPKYRIAVRFLVERPYHALFIKQLLIRPSEVELAEFSPDWTVMDMGRLTLDPSDGSGGDACVALDFGQKQVVIVGTQYAGEMKKSVFSIMNLLLPEQGVLSMHCSANVGAEGDTALFFGLSGTGKTTLSADPERRLIGDDEHGWTEEGVFNVEGGCYAKCIGLTRESEPEIFAAIRTGAILENVQVDANGVPDYASKGLTENTRAAYPINHIQNALEPSVGGHPKNIAFLTCDALGVLPPISRLTPEQAMDHFLNGYTSKLAGTEDGVTEPELTFSTCFGAPFLPLHPTRYAELLAEKIRRHGSKVWLVNTGWTGGKVGTGSRIKLRYTRALLKAAFSGALDHVEYSLDPIFGLSVPTTCPEVPDDILMPVQTWSDSHAYHETARFLADKFVANVRQFRA